MSPAALILALALAPQSKAPEGAGNVWLNCSPEPRNSAHPALLLVAAPPDSPAPVSVEMWGGTADTAIVDVRAELGPPDVAVLEQVRAARRLLLGPGDLQQWRAVLWQDPRPSALARALHESWADGAQVVARGPAALLLGGYWLDVEQDARGRSETVARRGLGLCPGVTLDGNARGVDLRPLAERLLARETDVGLWLAWRSGLRFEPDGARWVGIGEGPTLAFDARASRHSAGGVERVLVEWIGEGRAVLARDPLRPARPSDPGRIESRKNVELWNSRHWMVPPGEGRARESTGPDGRLLLVGLPERDGLARAAWMSFEP